MEVQAKSKERRAVIMVSFTLVVVLCWTTTKLICVVNKVHVHLSLSGSLYSDGREQGKRKEEKCEEQCW